MKIQIKSWLNGEVLFEGDFSCFAEAVKAAAAKKSNLRSANLRSADLSSANLRSADLSSADLSSADFSYAKNADYAFACTRILPDGDIIGWKKLNGGIIAKLLIPAEAKRSHAFGRKCRAEYAKVLELWDGKVKHSGEAHSMHSDSFSYLVGKTVKPTEKFDEDFTNECSTGIHFFITRLEAEQYEG